MPIDYEIFGSVYKYNEKKNKWLETETTLREQVDSTNNRAKIVINTDIENIGFGEISMYFDGKAGKIYTRIPLTEYCKVDDVKDLNVTDYNMQMRDPKANITSYSGLVVPDFWKFNQFHSFRVNDKVSNKVKILYFETDYPNRLLWIGEEGKKDEVLRTETGAQARWFGDAEFAGFSCTPKQITNLPTMIGLPF